MLTLKKYGTFLNEECAGIQTLLCVISHTIITELLLLSCFHLCKSLLWVFLPPFIEVISTNYTFFCQVSSPEKTFFLSEISFCQVSSEMSFFLSKILTHENFRSFSFFKLICLLPPNLVGFKFLMPCTKATLCNIFVKNIICEKWFCEKSYLEKKCLFDIFF